MRRGLLPIAVAVALAFPSTAGAFFSKFYTGPVGNGANNAGVEFKAHFRNKNAFQNGKRPRKVVDFAWFNVPIPGGCFDSSPAPSGFDMRVNRRRKFHGIFSVPQTNHKAIVHGRFKHHNRKAVGTLRLKGNFSGGCIDADTGPLDWVAHRGA
jgi:hypothetical protein